MKNSWFCAVLSLTLLFLNSSVLADTLESELPETQSLKTPLFLSAFMEMPSHSVLISTDAGRGNLQKLDQRVQYNPTFGPNIGISAAYGLWSLSLSKRLSFISTQDQQKYGKTQYDDWRLGFNVTPRLKLETYYQNYHGFYADLNGREGMQYAVVEGDAPTPDPDYVAPSESNIVNRPDISALSFGLRATYSFPIIPLMNEFASSDDQKLLAGLDFDFLTKVYYNHSRVGGSQALVPSESAGEFGSVAALKQFTTNTWGAGAGLSISYPFTTGFSAGMSALFGAGLQTQTNTFADREDSGTGMGEEMNFSLFLDWKNQKDGFRVEIYADSLSARVNNINFDSTSAGLNLVYYYDGISL